MPSRFPWTKAAPAQVTERQPAPELSRHVPPPRQIPEAYYDQDTLREVTYTAPSAPSSQPSTRSNSAFGTHSSKDSGSVGGHPYEQQHVTVGPNVAAAGPQSPHNKKSFKTRLGLGAASSSGEELQDTLKEAPAAKGIFGRKKSVVKRKEAPNLSGGSSSTILESEARSLVRNEDNRQPSHPKDAQGFEPFGPDFTREQLQTYHQSGSEPQNKQYIETYNRDTVSPASSTIPQAQYQIYHPPAIQEAQIPVQPALPSSRRASTEDSMISTRHSQTSSRPSSRQSHGYQLQQQQQVRGYENRAGIQQLPRREDSEPISAPSGIRQQRQSQSFDPNKLNSPGQISRENSTMNSSSVRSAEPNSSQVSHASPEENTGRRSPALPRSARDMSDVDINRLLKDYADLRTKYQNVKRQYFEKKDQVEGLQDSLAQQRLSQSRTCLDDGEYIARMTRLDGLVSQLAFIIRKDWKAIPDWLQASVNRDALQVGKQEMTAVGRAVISRWLAQELFDKYFHPGLEPNFSAQLKLIQKAIWFGSLPCHTDEEQENLISKIIIWRLTTAEGLKATLASPDAASYRQVLTHMLSQELLQELHQYVDEQAAGNLEGGITMIVELAVSILANLPLESRDVSIEYFPPGYPILPDLMKLESGIPALNGGSGEATEGDRSSMQESDSPSTESYEGEAEMARSHELPAQKKGFFVKGGGGGSGKKTGGSAVQKGAQKPPSPTPREETRPSVRLCAFLAVQIRGKMVLVKAPVFKV